MEWAGRAPWDASALGFTHGLGFRPRQTFWRSLRPTSQTDLQPNPDDDADFL